MCLNWSGFAKIKYTIFKSKEGNIFVIQDKFHDKILNEILLRRKAQMLQWYGEVNTENELEKEIEKFKWLGEQEVLSEAEVMQKISEAEYLLSKEDTALTLQ
ncbi:hypothetical protein [Microbulbifer sp. TYP-18]|uniref:hypothetical protein n=1 Tax=Microbulbifer sp. TYP-18 TaxID=3230024 RepID=UPI0034C5FC7B